MASTRLVLPVAVVVPEKQLGMLLVRRNPVTSSRPLPDKKTDADLGKLLFPDKSVPKSDRKFPDYDYIDKEMLRSGVTLKLLWNEYCEYCRQNRDIPLMYTQFCHHYQKYSDKKLATMHIPRKPGEQIDVDWAGKPAYIIDTDTGEMIPCHIFVGVLNYSLYAYVEAFLKIDLESWITAHIHMYQYFGGSTTILIPDNLKTGVDKTNDCYTPKINKTCYEMAEYYDTAVLPARVKAPKDKPGVEGSVNVVTNWITAAIRNEKFFALEELNREIQIQLEKFSHKPFQKKDGSRRSVYLADEKLFLTPLPPAPYELLQWKKATVQFNYHILVDKAVFFSGYFLLGEKNGYSARSVHSEFASIIKRSLKS